ncbi:MAG: radical SAM protein [Candidatus Omnitrophica bacterium]|nr:radical SAM protein [Candidatus Omnitrophota bacterium]MBU1995798.1 radical SAM protein [Candidatus Omnitrophota bacterium]MBU4333529.1 radical SAM protein [Candidatus Omnitrophota bacterium]
MSFYNRIKSINSYIKGKTTSGNVYRLVVEISNACNLKCSMCPRNNMERKVEFMTPKVFESIIKDNKETLEFVSLNGYGEPLMHPDLSKFLNICKKYKIKSGISTNCTLLDENRSKELLEDPPDQIILAIDGATSKSYEKVRVGANFDIVINNVKRFLDMRKEYKKKPFVVLQCIYLTETKSQINQFKELFKGYHYDAIRIRQLTHSGRDRSDSDYSNPMCSCSWIWNEPMILSDGTVVPCCQDVNGVLKLGNIFNDPLSKLWNTGSINSLREKHSSNMRKTINLCEQCNMYQPSWPLLLCSTFFNTKDLNMILPYAETMLSMHRYCK